MKRSHADEDEATERGACGVSILLIDAATDLQVVEQSRRGTRFDYWLGEKKNKGPYFQHKARLEVSGLRRATPAAVTSRVRAKIKQIKKSPVNLPGYVSVVEFGLPQARLMKI